MRGWKGGGEWSGVDGSRIERSREELNEVRSESRTEGK